LSFILLNEYCIVLYSLSTLPYLTLP